MNRSYSSPVPAHPAAATAFARDVHRGLTASPKHLPSKYFYDERGDRLFQQIMQMPEYYLTGCELGIFERRREDIRQAIGAGPFDLIELGAGDGYKTKVLLRHFLERGADFRYRPVDISASVLLHLEQDLREELPGLAVDSLPGDYFEVLEEVNRRDGRKKVIFFLGANIGNLEVDHAAAFLRRVRRNMHDGDLLLVGFDLKKDPQIILDAYNDPAGITAAFNLNLLARINRELGGHFSRDAFRHWETYDPVSGAARSFLVSTRSQRVRIDALALDVDFHAWEAVRVELSQKYGVEEIERMAAGAGFSVVRHFFDERRYFVDSLWRR